VKVVNTRVLTREDAKLLSNNTKWESVKSISQGAFFIEGRRDLSHCTVRPKSINCVSLTFLMHFRPVREALASTPKPSFPESP